MDQDELLEQEAEAFLDAISKNVERIREEKGMTKLDVSRELGFMAPDHYSRMELRANGKHFNLKHLYKLSKILDVDVSELITN
ncbi:MAG: helix-turn-helix transcriptional regulator [Spirochaetota bacterium]|nr:helix-turn-helix transcriptional regulator [Spirochaetota bacterium]